MGAGAAGGALVGGAKFEGRCRDELDAGGDDLVDVVMVDGIQISAVHPDQMIGGILEPNGKRGTIEYGAQALNLFGELADIMGEFGYVAALA